MGLDFSEEMIRLHINVEALLPPAEGRVLQFVASRRGEGTSTLSRAYAKVAAIEFRKRVLLLDADWGALQQPLNEAPQRHGRLPGAPEQPMEKPEQPVEKEVGESSLVPGVITDHVIEKTLVEPGEEPYFFFPVPSRQVAVSSAGQSFQIESLFATLRERFDVVVVDSPPVHKSSYSLVIARRENPT